MTVPYFENCPHHEDGWCLECVGNLGRKILDAEEQRISILLIEKIIRRIINDSQASDDLTLRDLAVMLSSFDKLLTILKSTGHIS